MPETLPGTIERKGRYRLQPAPGDSHSARHTGCSPRANLFNQLGCDTVLRMRKRGTKRYVFSREPPRVDGPPDLIATDLYFNGFVRECVLGCIATFEGGCVDKRLEGRTRLAAGLCHMVKLVYRIAPASHPGFHMPGAWIDSDEPGLQARLGRPQAIHERRITTQGV